MPRVILISENIKSKKSFKLINITQLNISNYSDNIAEVWVNGFKRSIPAFDKLTGCTIADFALHDNGNVMQDIKIDFRNSTYDIVLDYYQLTDESLNKC